MSEYKVKKQDVFNNKELYYELARYCSENNCVLSEDSEYYIAAPVPTPTFTELKEAKYNEIAADRYTYETSGITVDGAEIKTDRESVALLKGAYDEAKADPDYTVNWKASNGFVTLNAQQIITAYEQVRAHVQNAFDAEMVLDAQIDQATTEEELNAIEWTDPNE